MNKTHLPITKKEEEILSYIYGYIDDNKYSPTRQEIADYINNTNKTKITPQGVNYFVNQLVAKNKIKLIQKKTRNLKIV